MKKTSRNSDEDGLPETIEREDPTSWRQLVTEVCMRGGHIDALAYALPDGSLHVQFGHCNFDGKDPVEFLRFLADGLEPSASQIETSTRH